MAAVDVLIPTYNRRESLSLTLAGLVHQSLTDLRVIVADQSDEPVEDADIIQVVRRLIEVRGGVVEWHHRPYRRGIAEQRHFLLGQATADSVLFLDDDVYLEPWVVERLDAVLQSERCGFVGAFGSGLSHRDDVRPEQQVVEYWEGPVRPEAVVPDSPAWERWQLHRAANVYHLSQTIPPGEVRRYKVAWIGACVLYDRRKLVAIDGFSFWERLPRFHSGEEVLVQNILMRRWGGCGILPSGAWFSEVPTTVLNDDGSVDAHALDLLPEMIARYAPGAADVR